ncbi:MAG: zinc ribbon domain-containing protein [Syntrophobacteraceae bacterium]|nr:zinc ribbon domain-containing protein [Syntrophobacteraceae bacterium]
MPIYEYECLKCGKTTEAMQRFSDAPLSQCGECSGQLRKLISMSTFHLKGSGWYTTDYAGKNQSTAKPAENKTGCAETKTESKTESSTSDKHS